MQENGSLLIWDKLKDLIDAEIAEKTASCVRMKTMVVTTAYDETTKTVGVTEAFGTEVQLPVCGDMDGKTLAVGQSVWVMIPYSMSNAIVTMRGDGWKPNTAQNISMSAADTTSVYDVLNAKASALPQVITLPSTGWVLDGTVYTQTVSVSGMTADAAQSSAIVTPTADSAQESAVQQAKLRATGQGEGTLTFTCPSAPAADLVVNVLVIATGGAGSAV